TVLRIDERAIVLGIDEGAVIDATVAALRVLVGQSIEHGCLAAQPDQASFLTSQVRTEIILDGCQNCVDKLIQRQTRRVLSSKLGASQEVSRELHLLCSQVCATDDYLAIGFELGVQRDLVRFSLI